MFDWIIANKEWIFSGIGGSLLILFFKITHSVIKKGRKSEKDRSLFTNYNGGNESRAINKQDVSSARTYCSQYFSLTEDEFDRDVGTKFIEFEIYPIIINLPEKKNFQKSIAFIDIDELTIINTNFGINVGDEVLKTVGMIIKSYRSIKYFGRCGEDTYYAVILKSGIKKTLETIESIRGEIKSFNWGQIAPELRATCTIGYAILEPNEAIADWIARSLLGMKNGKGEGGDRVYPGPKYLGDKYKINFTIDPDGKSGKTIRNKDLEESARLCEHSDSIVDQYAGNDLADNSIKTDNCEDAAEIDKKEQTKSVQKKRPKKIQLKEVNKQPIINLRYFIS